MIVHLVEYTGRHADEPARAAAELLVTTKATRLTINESFEKVNAMDGEELYEELQYMASTIPSSWEFLDVTFLVEGVSRACAQQITRTRTGSYAMQSQRVTDASQMDVINPYSEDDPLFNYFNDSVECAQDSYRTLITSGATAQDARGLLPMNTSCNIWCKYNFRSFVDLVKARSSHRTQDEYYNIVMEMKKRVIAVWPFAALFFTSSNDKALALLDEIIKDAGLDTGKGTGWKAAKVQDLLR